MGTPTPIGRSSSSQTVCALQASAASSRAASRGGARPTSSPHSSPHSLGTAAASASGGAGSGCSAAASGCARAPLQDPRHRGGRVACARRRRRARGGGGVRGRHRGAPCFELKMHASRHQGPFSDGSRLRFRYSGL